MRARRAVACVLVLAAACSDSTGTNSTSIAGRWLLTAQEVRVPGNPSCSFTVQLDLTQAGAVLDGSYSKGDLDCHNGASGYEMGGFIDGSIDGKNFALHLDTEFIDVVGEWSGNQMVGTVSWTTVPGFTGSFSAQRQ